ncbi:hypothetical protein FZC84_21300 [Rossellomorea vietnamensis]|uniref:Uncharacterized protein n=1 Tax=Rossellomorea vietnamensis TaxID=218284 RepID=A0A5D4M2H4_9BACI|nr:hypothetical protein [Rossellomorea vietnamensis]TYR95731.1 hypothetical protein FZC84_21300 [Rossellomorea vietnamensis]
MSVVNLRILRGYSNGLASLLPTLKQGQQFYLIDKKELHIANGDGTSTVVGRELKDGIVSTSTVYSSAKVEELITGVRNEIAALEARVSDNEATLDDFGTRINAVEAKNTEQDGRLDAVEQSVSDEVARAQAAEQTNAQAVVDEETRAKGEEARIEEKADQNADDLAAHKTNQTTKDGDQDAEINQNATNISDLQSNKLDSSEVGQTVASLDEEGYVPLSQINPVYREIRVYADIVTRDADAELFEGKMAYVEADGGFYLYNGTAWIQVSDADNVNAVTEWADVKNKPSFIVALGQDAEGTHLTFDGKKIAHLEELTAVETSLLQAVSDEEARAIAEEQRIEGKVDQEIADRQAADEALTSEIARVEGRVGEVGTVEVDETNLVDGGFMKYNASTGKLEYVTELDAGTFGTQA